MDDIMIDIPNLQEQAHQFNKLAADTYDIIEQLVVILSQLKPIWQDETFNRYSTDVNKLIQKLLQMQEATLTMARICDNACDTYQQADENVRNLV